MTKGNYYLSEMQREKVRKLIVSRKTTREISDTMGVSPSIIRSIAKNANLQLRLEKVYAHKGHEDEKWVNLIARNSGLPDSMI